MFKLVIIVPTNTLADTDRNHPMVTLFYCSQVSIVFIIAREAAGDIPYRMQYGP